MMEREIEISSAVRARVDEVRRVLRDCPAQVFGDPEHDERSLEPHQFRSTIPVVLGSGAAIEHDVIVDIGRVPGDERPLTVHFELHPVDHGAVLPSFRGEMRVLEDEENDGGVLTVRGGYTAPLGPVGRLGDGLVGRRVARASLEAFVARMCDRVDHAVGSTSDQGARWPQR